jgi:hypothetical protein
MWCIMRQCFGLNFQNRRPTICMLHTIHLQTSYLMIQRHFQQEDLMFPCNLNSCVCSWRPLHPHVIWTLKCHPHRGPELRVHLDLISTQAKDTQISHVCLSKHNWRMHLMGLLIKPKGNKSMWHSRSLIVRMRKNDRWSGRLMRIFSKCTMNAALRFATFSNVSLDHVDADFLNMKLCINVYGFCYLFQSHKMFPIMWEVSKKFVICLTHWSMTEATTEMLMWTRMCLRY